MSTEFIGKTKGDSVKHIYVKLPYEIRVCDWCIPESDFEDIGDAPMCKRCQAIRDGKRKAPFVYKVNS